MYETGAPPPPPPLLPDAATTTVQVEGATHVDPLSPGTADRADRQDGGYQPVRPARGHEAVTAILPGQPPGTTTYRLRGTETAQSD